MFINEQYNKAWAVPNDEHKIQSETSIVPHELVAVEGKALCLRPSCAMVFESWKTKLGTVSLHAKTKKTILAF